MTSSSKIRRFKNVLALACCVAVSNCYAIPTFAARLEGIDVSHWQGSLAQSNWNSIAGAGKTFVFMKASEGTNYTDPQFATNMSRATNAGLLAGAYHFARPDLNSSAVEEANWFVSVAGTYMTYPNLRPVLDLEVAGVSTTAGKAFLSNWVNDFMNRVVALKGASAEPIIYVNSNYASNYLNSTVASRTLWIANWPSSPNPQTGSPATGVFSNWAFWQYTSSGSVSGISGNVDLDVVHGDIDYLHRFVIPEPPGHELALAAFGAVLLLCCAGAYRASRRFKSIQPNRFD